MAWDAWEVKVKVHATAGTMRALIDTTSSAPSPGRVTCMYLHADSSIKTLAPKASTVLQERSVKAFRACISPLTYMYTDFIYFGTFHY